MKSSNARSGSALVLILIAVAMFAALSYAVIQGGRNGSVQAVSNDQARIAATEIIAYGDALAKAVQTLRLRGCSETQFDFYNSIWHINNGNLTHPLNQNPNAPSDSSCSIFNVNAGKLNAISLSGTGFSIGSTSSGSTAVGSSYINRIDIPGIGTSKEDIVWVLPWPTTQTCMTINNIVGVKNNTAAPPAHTWVSQRYAGVFSETASLGDSDNLLAGKTAFCAYDTTPGDLNNRFYRVLLAR